SHNLRRSTAVRCRFLLLLCPGILREEMTTPELSVVIPCHNEAENLRPLLAAIHAALDPLALDFEVVITDDCSSDDSWHVLQELSGSDPRLRAQRFKFNCGESAAS